MIRNRAVRRGSHGAAGTFAAAPTGEQRACNPGDRRPHGELFVLELTTLGLF
jgi:hypothetical protein